MNNENKDIGTMEKQLVLFELNEEVYGVDIAAVHEIIRMQPITKVPKAPFYVEGILNLRGRVIPVVDMRKRFGLSKVDQTKDNRIVVVDSCGQNIGIIVDAVTEVLRIPANSVELPSDIITTSDSDYLMGIAKHGETMIILLDLDKVLSFDSSFASPELSSEIPGNESHNNGKINDMQNYEESIAEIRHASDISSDGDNAPINSVKDTKSKTNGKKAKTGETD